MKKFILIFLTAIAFTACDEIRMKEMSDLKDEIGDFSKLKVKLKNKEVKRSSF